MVADGSAALALAAVVSGVLACRARIGRCLRGLRAVIASDDDAGHQHMVAALEIIVMTVMMRVSRFFL